MPLQRLTPGTPFRPSARTWDAFVDVAEAHRNGQLPSSAGGLDGHGAIGRNASILRIRNTTDSAVMRGGVLKPDEPIIGPNDGAIDAMAAQLGFQGIKPAANRPGRVAILIEPAGAGQIARACYDGVCIARVKLADDGEAEFAAAAEDETEHLVATDSGPAEVLWHEEGEADEVVWAIVRLGAPTARRFAARLTHTSKSDLNEISENEYTYPWGEEQAAWDDSNKRITFELRGDAYSSQHLVDTDPDVWNETVERFATNSIEQLAPDAWEQFNESGWFADPGSGESVAPGRVQRGALPPNTQVMMREVVIDGTARYYIESIRGGMIGRGLCGPEGE